eukprot:GGOE01020826.1.p1 GENE.GGOE01020826.1~~GGOE01020826.1.p1  ORF type:complete len:333 (-),score=64.30 GGOE01020826.1:92-1090(-)
MASDADLDALLGSVASASSPLLPSADVFHFALSSPVASSSSPATSFAFEANFPPTHTDRDAQPLPPVIEFVSGLVGNPLQAGIASAFPLSGPLPPLPAEAMCLLPQERPLCPLPLLPQSMLLPSAFLKDPEVSNVLSTCHLGLQVDTRQVARRLWNAEFNRKQGSLTLKSSWKRLAIAVYPSGKMTCMGARNEATARAELRRYARLVQQSIRIDELPKEVRGLCDPGSTHVYQKARFLGFRIANIKAEWELGFHVDLHGFYDKYASHFNVYYEPDIFPALKLTLTAPKLTMQVFTTGTVGITGATSVADVTFACKEVLYPLARPCMLSLPLS